MATFTTKIVIICALLALASACSLTRSISSLSSSKDPSELSPDQFSREIKRIENILHSDNDPDHRKKAHLQLAGLYISSKNPKPNYKLALIQFENYAALDPTLDNQYSVRDWLVALKEMKRLSMAISAQKKQIEKLSLQIKQTGRKNLVTDKKKLKLSSQNKDLKRINSELRKKNQALAGDNQKLEQTIEMLKNLDRRLEEKRQSFHQ